jgi:2-methylcitrate dehydratase PrpD
MGRMIEKLASFTTTIQFGDLPEEAIHEMKRVLLDSIGCAINGVSTDRGQIAIELARKLGGPREASVFGTNDKVSSANAAFANGELINALDFDAFSGGHSAPILIPPALALGESIGASGKNIIMALALGFEISSRLKSQGRVLIAEGPDKSKIKWREVYGHSATALAAAACAGKILNLDQGKMVNAIGIAGCMCPPNIQAKWMRTSPVRMTKYGPAGWSAHVAVSSALLADMGYTGDTDLFESDYGFWRYTADEEWKKEEVLEDLGIEWSCHKVSYKQYPAGL